VRAATINGLAGFVLREQDGSIDTMAFEHHDGRIVAIYVTRNQTNCATCGFDPAG
jgi:RNA polymerase sigma-70 factor, ECF subfamily